MKSTKKKSISHHHQKMWQNHPTLLRVKRSACLLHSVQSRLLVTQKSHHLLHKRLNYKFHKTLRKKTHKPLNNSKIFYAKLHRSLFLNLRLLQARVPCLNNLYTYQKLIPTQVLLFPPFSLEV
ncbi:hypothetical protein PBCV1_a489R [Paramecium bursaria Chlorella virus 1]|uniref:Uncharacterized protein n=1 Tax=Paramecium bursaria Chlorella virus 1 TaxID=10506 RepID=Q98539_PBCV1|nr:hypothetical protein PBCV1_a489R [Paramecium bursaria Chlorella virus 1]AAC96856.1 hypothetical protein [Paramecium bursaria Chlorella virus 1]